MTADSTSRLVIRNARAVILVEIAGALWPLIGSVLAFTRGSSIENPWIKMVLLVLGAAMLLHTVVRALEQLFVVRLTATIDGVTYSAGVVVRRKHTFDWSAIATVDQQTNPIQERLGGVKIRVSPVGADHLACEMRLVPKEVAARLVDLYQQHHHEITEHTRNTDDSPAGTPAAWDDDTQAESAAGSNALPGTATPAGKVLFNGLSWRDTLILAVGNGGVFLGIPIVFTLLDMVGDLGFSFERLWDAQLHTKILWAAVGLALTLTLGIARTMLIYANWRVTLTASSIRIRSGAFTAHTTDFPLGKAAVITIHQPLSLRWLNRVHIRAVTAAPMESSTKNIVIPVCSENNTAQHLKLLGMAAPMGPAPRITNPLELILRVGFALAGILPVAAGFWALWAVPWDLPALAPWLVLLFIIPVLRTATARAHDHGEYQVVTYGLMGRVTTVARRGDLNAEKSWELSLPSGRALRVTTTFYLANGIKKVRTFQLLPGVPLAP